MIPSILICGKTGAGKTSLIQALSSKETVPDDAIGHFEPTTRGVVVYKTPVANFVDCEGMEPGQTIRQYADFVLGEVQKRLEFGEAENVITGVFYCIDGSGGRIQHADEVLIGALDEEVNVVLTKADIIREKQLEKLIGQLEEIVPPEKIFVISSCRADGLTRLQECICDLAEHALADANEKMDEFKSRWEEYYREKLAAWEASASREADHLVGCAVWRSVALSLLPVPLDIVPQSVNELYMIHRIGGVYGHSVSRDAAAELAGKLGFHFIINVGLSFLMGFKILVFPVVVWRAGKAAKAYFASGEKKCPEEEFRAEFRRTGFRAGAGRRS